MLGDCCMFGTHWETSEASFAVIQVQRLFLAEAKITF